MIVQLRTKSFFSLNRILLTKTEVYIIFKNIIIWMSSYMIFILIFCFRNLQNFPEKTRCDRLYKMALQTC